MGYGRTRTWGWRGAVALSFVSAFAHAGPVPGAFGESGVKPTFNETPQELENVEVTEHLGQKLPLGALFRDSQGRPVRLGEFFQGERPVVVVFAYHTCPVLCSLVLDATVKGLRDVSWTVGRQFDVVSISIDPRDTPERAEKKRAEIVAKYGRGTEGFHFLVGDEPNIRSVTDAVGFQYRYDERQGQYAHPAAIYLASGQGVLSRYLYGISFNSSDIRLGLLEASEGRSMSTPEKILLYCYHYDPQGHKYTLVAMNVMRLGGGLTATLLGGFLGILWFRERRRKHANGYPPAPSRQELQVQAP